MKVKLTEQQAPALYGLLNAAMNVVVHSPDDKLILVHIRSIFKRLRNKLEEPKKKYSLSLTDAEALAYWIFFRDTDLSNFDYEQNFIAAHVTDIAQHFGDSTYKLLTPINQLNSWHQQLKEKK